MKYVFFSQKNFWRDKKIWFLIFLSLITIFLFYLYNGATIKQEKKTINNEMEQTLFWGSDNPYEDFSPEEWDDPETTLAMFKLRYDYAQSWEQQDMVLFDKIQKHYSKQYIQYLSQIPAFIKDNLDLSIYPATEFSNNTSKIITYLQKNGKNTTSVRYGITGSSFLTGVLPIITSLLGMSIFLLMFGSIIVGDFENSTIKLILTNGISKKKFFFTNVTLTILINFIFVITLALFSFGLGAMLGGAGDINYPLFIGDEKFISTSNFWVQVIVLFFFVEMFITLFFFCVAVVFKKLIPSIVISLGLLTAFQKLSFLELLNPIAEFNPFIYLNPSLLFIGRSYEDAYFVSEAYENLDFSMVVENLDYYLGKNIQLLVNNSDIHLETGIFSLFLGSIFLTWLGLLFFNRQDFG